MIYTVYILFSEKHQKIYIGYTSNILNRIKSHNKLGKDWTAGFRPWIVVYSENFSEKQHAMNREKQLKSASARQRIWELIRTEYTQNGFISGL